MFACICVCARMSDEVFGNLRAGLIITDISLDAFRPRSSWERSVMPPDPKVKDRKDERERETEREVRRNDAERQRQRTKKAHKMKKKGGKV